MEIARFKSAGAGVIIVETVFTKAVLLSSPPAKEHVEPWNQTELKIRVVQQLVLTTDDKLVMADATVESVSYYARQAMTDLWMDARKEVGNNAQAPLMKKLVPSGLTGFKKLGPEDTCNDLGRVLLVLQEPGMSPKLAAHIKPLQEVVKQYEKPIAALKAARLAADHAGAQWIEAREAWINARVALFGALTTRFPNRPGYVSSFFKQQPAAKKAALAKKDERADADKSPKAAAA